MNKISDNKREIYYSCCLLYSIHYRSAWLMTRLTRRITVAALLQREARLVAELHRWSSHRQTYQHQGLVKSTRVETSHWSRSVQILRSDWLRSWCCYTSFLLCHEDTAQGTKVPMIDSFCTCPPSAWSLPIRAQYFYRSGPMRGLPCVPLSYLPDDSADPRDVEAVLDTALLQPGEERDPGTTSDTSSSSSSSSSRLWPHSHLMLTCRPYPYTLSWTYPLIFMQWRSRGQSSSHLVRSFQEL